MIEGMDIDLTSFAGKTKILHGVEVDVEFDDGALLSREAWTEPPTLVIRGITRELAISLLAGSRNRGAAAAAPTTVKQVFEGGKDPDRAAIAVTLAAAKVTASVTEPVTPPAPPEAPVPTTGSPVLGDEQVAVMDKMDKIRTVVEYMVSIGLKDSEQIVAAATICKDQVKVLRDLAAKGGNFDRKMERAVSIVLGPF